MVRTTPTPGSPFPSMPNFRQINYDSNDQQQQTGPPKLYRSSRPDFLTSSEVGEFRDLGIRSIIDFRSAKEYRKATGSKLLDPSFPVYKVKIPLHGGRYSLGDTVKYNLLDKSQVVNQNETPIDQGQGGKHFILDFFKMNYIWAVFNRAPWHVKLYSMLFLIFDVIFNTGYKYFVRVFARNVLNKGGLLGQYIDMITYSQASICAALKLLSDPRNVPCMLNCAHGKDRTGIVTAMVLAILGETHEFIAYDYSRSEVELEPMRERLHSEIVKKFNMCTSFTTSKAITMQQVLEYIDSKYGSIPNYLTYIGFGPEDQKKLREVLTS